MDTLFSITSALVLPAWLALAVAPTRRWTQRVAGILLPVVLGLVYVGVLMLTVVEPSGAGGGFGSLDEVATLFSDRRSLLAGWVHYLAFDLFVGAWEARDADREGVSRWVLVPCLALTFLVGPAGLVVYLAARAVVRRSRMGGSSPGGSGGDR